MVSATGSCPEFMPCLPSMMGWNQYSGINPFPPSWFWSVFYHETQTRVCINGILLGIKLNLQINSEELNHLLCLIFQFMNTGSLYMYVSGSFPLLFSNLTSVSMHVLANTYVSIFSSLGHFFFFSKRPFIWDRVTTYIPPE